MTCAISRSAYLPLKPSLQTLMALVSKPNFLAPSSKSKRVGPLIYVPRVSLNFVIVISFLYYIQTATKHAIAQSVI